jgi:hypothetical protein
MLGTTKENLIHIHRSLQEWMALQAIWEEKGKREAQEVATEIEVKMCHVMSHNFIMISAPPPYPPESRAPSEPLPLHCSNCSSPSPRGSLHFTIISSPPPETVEHLTNL